MSFFDRHIRGRRPGKRITPQQMVAIKGILNLIVTEAYAGTTIGQINVASEYYYGSPEPSDYDDMFERLHEATQRMKDNGGATS